MHQRPAPALAEGPAPAPVLLRPYQQECIGRVIAAYEQNPHGHELLVLPTAAGKTVIFSQVIHELTERYGIHALIVAHTDELLNQAAEKYRQVKPAAIIGKVGSGLHEYGGLRHEAAYIAVGPGNRTQPDVLPSVLYRDMQQE